MDLNHVIYNRESYKSVVNLWWELSESNNLINIELTVTKGDITFETNEIVIHNDILQNPTQKSLQLLGQYLIRMMSRNNARNILIKQKPDVKRVMIVLSPSQDYNGSLYLLWDKDEWNDIPVFYDNVNRKYYGNIDDQVVALDDKLRDLLTKTTHN